MRDDQGPYPVPRGALGRAPARSTGEPPRPATVPAAPLLDELVAEAGGLRPLPDVARRLLAIAEGDDFSLQDLAIVVSADQALTAKILRIANSPSHRHNRQIVTIRDAVVLLGFRTVRSAALAASLMQATPPETNYIDYPEFWRFSVAVGLLAESMAGQSPDRHMAFTAGVMHNLGRLAIDQMAPRALARTAEFAQSRGISLRDAQRELFGFTEAELGVALATHWNYPETLVAAIAAGDADPGASEAGSLAELVFVARHAAESAGLVDGLPVPLASGAHGGAQLADPGDGERALAQLGGLDQLGQRVDAFLEGVFPDRIRFAD